MLGDAKYQLPTVISHRPQWTEDPRFTHCPRCNATLTPGFGWSYKCGAYWDYMDARDGHIGLLPLCDTPRPTVNGQCHAEVC